MNITEQYKYFKKTRRRYRTKQETSDLLNGEIKSLLRDVKHRKEQFWNDPSYWDLIIAKGYDFLVNNDLYIKNTYRRLDKKCRRLQRIRKSL